jgi:hypothetical protein
MFTPVPQGRLSLAQDVVLGGLTQIAIVPQGRLVQPLQAEDKLWTKGTASAVPCSFYISELRIGRRKTFLPYLDQRTA